MTAPHPTVPAEPSRGDLERAGLDAERIRLAATQAFIGAGGRPDMLPLVLPWLVARLGLVGQGSGREVLTAEGLTARDCVDELLSDPTRRRVLAG